MYRWLRRQPALARIGYRGSFLAVLGLFDIFYGLYLLLGGQLQYPLQLTNFTWGWVWTGTGMFLLAGALIRRDAVFFAGAALVKTAWALEFTRLALVSSTGQWPRAANWACLALLVLVASAWPEPGAPGREKEP